MGEGAKSSGGAIIGTANFGASLFNTVNLLVGLGILSYPFALREAGVGYGIILLLLTALVCRYTAQLLGDCIEKGGGPEECGNYVDIAKKAFGRTGVIVISACFMLECAISGGVSYMLVFGTSLHALFPSLPLYLALLVAGAVMTPTTWLRDLSVFSYLSLLGIATSCFLVGVLLYSGFTAPEEEGSLLEPSPMCWFNTRDVAYSIGLWMVGFGGHPSLPSVYVSMQDRGTFPRVLDIAFALTTVIYGGTAAAGYMMYGPDVRPEISLNLPHGALTTAVLWALLISTLCKFAMAIVPVSAVLEDLLEASGLWTVRPLPPGPCARGVGGGPDPPPGMTARTAAP